MFMAIAAESSKHPARRGEYRVWYLEIDKQGEVIGIGVKSRKELVENLFRNYRETGKSNWRAFTKRSERSVPIEIYDFISQNLHENTHFGDLPTLAEFQQTLDCLEMGLDIKSRKQHREWDNNLSLAVG